MSLAKVALIQGSSSGIGLAVSRALLQKTDLCVVATSRDPSKSRRAILEGLDNASASRLTSLELDVKQEDTIRDAAKAVEKEFGKGSLRFLLNVSGILRVEKNIASLEEKDLFDSFRINHFGHLLTYKRFIHLLPRREADLPTKDDPAKGTIKPGLSVLASMSARVGSIGDNRKGGWYSYRSSKAAVNQSIVSLARELRLRNLPAAALAYHPGTVISNLSRDYVSGEPKPEEGVFKPEQASDKLLDVVSELEESESGAFKDWAGKAVPW